MAVDLTEQRILITGSNGMLGQALMQVLSDQKPKSLLGVGHGADRGTQQGYRYESVDLTDHVALMELLWKEKPTVIINAAAMTQVDDCEDAHQQCLAINTEAVRTLVSYCQESSAYLLQISTDFVFDGEGEKGIYNEEDAINPVNFYGVSKARAEEVIAHSGIRAGVLRTILVYGKPINPSRSNVVLWVLDSLRQQKPIQVINDQFRMPTSAHSLASACVRCVQNEAKGVFHFSSNELLSVYEIAQTIGDVFGLDTSLITPTDSSTLNQRAKRPPKTGFNLSKIEALGVPTTSFKQELIALKPLFE